MRQSFAQVVCLGRRRFHKALIEHLFDCVGDLRIRNGLSPIRRQDNNKNDIYNAVYDNSEMEMNNAQMKI